MGLIVNRAALAVISFAAKELWIANFAGRESYLPALR